MADQPGTLEQIAIRLARALARLTERLDGEGFPETLARLGIAFPPALLARPGVVSVRDALSAAAGGLPATIDALIAAAEAEDLSGIVARGVELRDDAIALIDAFDDLPAAIDAARGAFPEIGDAQFAGFADRFARKLLDLLIADLLDDVPGVGASLALAGLIERVRPFEMTDLDRLGVERTTIHYDRIARLLGDPAEHFKAVYDWGSPEFDGTKLLPVVAELLGRLGAPAAYHAPTESTSTLLEAYVIDVRPDTAIDPPGLDISIVAPFGGTIDEPLPLPDPAWSGRFSARGRFTTVLTGKVRPPLNVVVVAPTVSFEGGADVDLTGEREKGFVLVGTAGGNRLEVKTVTLGAGIAFSSAAGSAGVEPFVEAALAGGRVLIDGSAADGFISKMLSGVKIDSTFDVGVAWKLSTGIRFDGSSALTIMLPVHADLGPFSVREIFLVATLEEDRIPLELSASVSAKLGPIDATVNRIGFTSTVSFPGAGGNAGPAQVDFAFKPPTGVGLALDVHGIKGGGFLDADGPNHRYVGMLQLQFQDRIDLTAVGVINTQLPDGRDGFSLLILISAEFQPIQLGLGFTLNGVGGLLGLNRTVDIEVLRQGLRTNSLSSVMFPDDPIANASQIISDITAIFPPSRGCFIIGPMAKIGYGTPTLITLDAGLVIDAPDPLRIALLGVLKAVLPDEEAPLIELHVNFLGVIDFQAGEVAFDASLFDSRLLAFNLSGDVAVRARWFGLKMVLLSVGGFHPSFQPPPLGLPSLKRLTLQLLDGKNPRLRLEMYLAVTSNTRQFGARLELSASAGPFDVYGFLSFDVLFQFSPFYFIADIKAMVALRSGSKTIAGISLALTLEGPTPWKAKGTASLKLFWFLTVKVRISKEWGESGGAVLDTLAVLPLVIDALGRDANWRAELPEERHLLVTLRTSTLAGEAIVVHPLGGLSIGQQVVPFGVPIDKFGDRKPSDHRVFTISNVRANGQPVDDSDVAPLQDHFAPAQFFDRTDAEKLSADSFVQYAAGIELGVSSQLASSDYVGREVDYELKYRDSQRVGGPSLSGGLFQVDAVAFSAWAQNGAVARSPLSFAATGKSAIAPDAVSIGQEAFAVANISDLALAHDGAVASSEAEAVALMNRLVASRPELAGRVQVVPSYEVNRRAA